MANIGVYPVDPTTPVGKLRSDIGDTNGAPIDPIPPETDPTTANYQYFSDADIENILEQAGDNYSRALSYAYIKLAAAFSAQSVSAKTYDLSVDLTKRASDFRSLANFWRVDADSKDKDAGLDEGIFFASNDIDPTYPLFAEAALRYGRGESSGLSFQ